MTIPQSIRRMAYAIVVCAVLPTSVNAQEPEVDKFGLYVIVTDLSKSRAFYERLFQKPPYFSNDRLIGFDIAGGLYALFSANAADRNINKGNSTTPFIRVKDAMREFERVKALNATLLDDQVKDEGAIKLFRIADPDGNMIEFYSVSIQSR